MSKGSGLRLWQASPWFGPVGIRPATVLLAAIFLPTLAVVPRAEAFVYSSSPATHTPTGTLLPGSTGRANLDGSGVDQSFITGADFPTAVAVDAAHGYWTDSFANTIGRATLDGTGVDHSFITGATARSSGLRTRHRRTRT